MFHYILSDLLMTNMSDSLQHVTVSIETNRNAQQYSLWPLLVYRLWVPLVDHLQNTWSLVDRRCQGLLVVCTGETCSEWVSWVSGVSEWRPIVHSIHSTSTVLSVAMSSWTLWTRFSDSVWLPSAMLWHSWHSMMIVSYSTVYTQYWPSTAVTHKVLTCRQVLGQQRTDQAERSRLCC